MPRPMTRAQAVRAHYRRLAERHADMWARTRSPFVARQAEAGYIRACHAAANAGRIIRGEA